MRMSRPRAARNNPVSPPMVNSPMKARAYNIGVSRLMEPWYIVAVQLKTFTAEGIATAKLSKENTSAEYVEMPATNMWCAQTTNPNTAIARLEKATKVYPKMRLREKQGMSSLITPIPGRIMM